MTRQRSIKKNDRTLRMALGANAAFSTLSAVVFMSLSEAVGAFVGLSASTIFSIGIDLALFAAFLTFLVRRPDLSTKRARIATWTVIALDLLWVVGSAVALFGASPLTTGGKIAVGVVALMVADLAFFQFLGLRRMESRRKESRRMHSHDEGETTLGAPSTVTT